MERIPIRVGEFRVLPVLFADELAEVIGVTVEQIEALADAGAAPGFRLVEGSRLVFECAATISWMRQLCVENMRPIGRGEIPLFPDFPG